MFLFMGFTTADLNIMHPILVLAGVQRHGSHAGLTDRWNWWDRQPFPCGRSI